MDDCPKGCFLLNQVNTKDKDSCLHCKLFRYRDMHRRYKPIKVLRHYHIIPQIQQMHLTPTLSKLRLEKMHERNTSTECMKKMYFLIYCGAFAECKKIIDSKTIDWKVKYDLKA